jgi:succinate-semialdehyde dehydrogenase/glutarate-semialdehyde dehydrogenase
MTDYPDLQLFIGGEWKSADGQPVLNPADESVIGVVPHASRADLDTALAAAESGFQIWRRTSPAKRAEIILKAAALVRQRVEEMAVAMTLEQGKPIAQSRLEILRGCDIIEWDATEGRRVYGRVIPSEPGMRHTVLRQPIGVVAAFSPWNFPMSSPARKVAGALSAGCAIILKASEETPAGAVQLVRAFHDAGLPQGVLNLVFGVPSDVSEYLIPQPSVRLVTFTGSIPVGKKLAAMAGQYMKPAIMELGGHAPVIVCDDVDPLATAGASALGKSPMPDRSASRRRASLCRRQSTRSSRMHLPRRRPQSRSATASIRPTRWARSPITVASRRWKRWWPMPNRRARACWRAAAASAIAATIIR